MRPATTPTNRTDAARARDTRDDDAEDARGRSATLSEQLGRTKGSETDARDPRALAAGTCGTRAQPSPACGGEGQENRLSSEESGWGVRGLGVGRGEGGEARGEEARAREGEAKEPNEPKRSNHHPNLTGQPKCYNYHMGMHEENRLLSTLL